MRERERVPETYKEPPCRVRIITDEADTNVLSRRETGIHTPGSGRLNMRYKTMENRLGAGEFSSVYKAINVDSGKFMAIKLISSAQEDTKTTRRKVDAIIETRFAMMSALD